MKKVALKNTIVDFAQKHDRGLLVLAVPTGFGKTFTSVEIMQEEMKKASLKVIQQEFEKRRQNTESLQCDRFFYVTNLKSNVFDVEGEIRNGLHV